MTTYYGWIPSLSGEVSEPLNLATLNGLAFKYQYKDEDETYFELEFGHSFDEDGTSVLTIERTDYEVGKQISESTFRFMFVDHAGLCVLEDSTHSIFQINEVWLELRRSLDGCSDRVTNCVAMNKMVSFKESPKTDSVSIACRKIARRFVDSLETDGDFANYIMVSGRYVPDSDEAPSYVSRAVYQSNALYLEAFLSFYGKYLPDIEVEYYLRTKDFRVRKNDIIADHFDNEHRSKAETRTDLLTKLGIAVALAIGIASIVLAAYGIYTQ